MKFQSLDTCMQKLSDESDKRKSLDIAIETANEVIKILSPSSDELPKGEDTLDQVIGSNQFPNHKIENWFTEHPYFTGNRVALKFYTSDLIETKFYWLNDNATKARVSAGVMLTPNWEDSDLTRNDQYKVGVDFFLSSDAKALILVVSNKGNLRLLELSDRLTHTQVEIFQNLQNTFDLDTREKIHRTLWDSLALSEVNKKFYAGIAEQFNILLTHLVDNGRDKEDSKLFASRLLGRLLFVWFLRKKGIIDETQRYFDVDSPDSTNYYKQSLERLFYITLNTPIEERDELTRKRQQSLFPDSSEDEQPSLFKYDAETPYLNGGLFEAHDNDWANEVVDFPKGYFNGLYEHLEKYNFTTDESSPEYEQVAIDPEMLGRVFESLLATQVTETGKTARDAKGAFYTPREIVSYMCRESLRQYLYTSLDNSAWNEGVDKLLDTSDSEWELSHSNSKRNLWGEVNRNIVPQTVITALDELKVLDPACGSGAYPMGMLQIILKTYERIEPRFNPYTTKFRIIEENIYGVDIEPMAVEISRLRAWLSIVVDSDKDQKDFKPLPNLDFKFIVANSLLPLSKDFQLGDERFDKVRSKMQWIIGKYFNATDKEEKKNLRQEFSKQSASLSQTSIFGEESLLQQQLNSFKPFDVHSEAIFFDAKLMFGLKSKTPFDMIIANPPYVQVKKDTIPSDVFPYTSTKDKGKQNLYKVFIEHAYNLVKAHGVVCYITQSSLMCDISSSGTRELLLDYTKLSQIIEFPKASSDKTGQVFDSVLQGTCIVLFVKAKPGEAHSFKISAANNINTITNLRTADITAGVIRKVFPNELYIPLVSQNQEVRLLIDVSEHSVRFDSLIKAGQQGDFNLGNDKKHFGTTPSDVLMYRGNGFRRYTSIENKNKNGENEFIQGNFKPTRVKQNEENIFLLSHNISGTTDERRLVFTITTRNSFLCGDSINKNLLNHQSQNELLLGILNSKLLDWIFRCTSTNNHVNSYEIEGLPVPKPDLLNSEIANSISSKVKEVLSAKSDTKTANTIYLESQIDQLVYQLYDLTPEEIAIIESSIK